VARIAVVDAVLAVNPVARVDYPVRPAIAAAPAAPTDLPVTARTRPAVSISAARSDLRNTDQGATGISRTIFDPRTNAVVFQSINASTGGVVEQLPSQTLLRQRAYVLQALINGKDFSAAVVAAAQGVDTTI
jgi:flagellar protein FlaG